MSVFTTQERKKKEQRKNNPPGGGAVLLAMCVFCARGLDFSIYACVV